MEERCGEPTPSGPCTMKKGHSAKFHRNREYPNPLEWRIKLTATNKVIEFGEGRMQLGYAITRHLNRHRNLTIELER